MVIKYCKELGKFFISIIFLGANFSLAAANTDLINPKQNIYSAAALNKKEQMLQNITKKIDDYSFVLLQAGNTTPAAWIIQTKQGQKLALLKCTSGNNYANGEIAAYYLGRKLNFPIFPVTIPFQINPS